MGRKSSDQDCFSHLTRTAREAVKLPDRERIARIRADRWIGYPRAIDAIKRLDELLNWPRKQRMPNLLIVGPTNNGKSMIIEKYRRDHAPQPLSEEERELIPLIAVQMPSDPSISRFYAMLLKETGTPLQPRMRTQELEQTVLSVLSGIGLRMLVIDELHNILAGPTKLQREFLNLIRFLGNELRVPIVGLGTKEAYLAIRSDDQLENRFEPFTLPVWREGPELVSLLASFEASLPLRRPSMLGTDEVARYVLARSEGTIGEMTKLLTAAAIAAIESGQEVITAKSLGGATYAAPSERRRAFERETVGV